MSSGLSAFTDGVKFGARVGVVVYVYLPTLLVLIAVRRAFENIDEDHAERLKSACERVIDPLVDFSDEYMLEVPEDE